MEIRVNCRLKLASGVHMNPGVYSDTNRDFHWKIYDEIERGSDNVTVLSGGPNDRLKKKAPRPPVDGETTMTDPGDAMDTATSEEHEKTEPKKPSRSSRRRTK